MRIVLPRNSTKSAVRNFLPAFGAPGELTISLLLPGGPNYLFKIRFLVFFPSFAKLRARRRGPGYFSSYLLRRRSFCCSSSFFSMAVPVEPDPAALAALQNPDPDPQAPAGQAVQNPDLQVATPQPAGQVHEVRASFPSYLLC